MSHDLDQIRDALAGVSAVMVTPFAAATGAVDDALAAELARRSDAAGIQAITALGNTAELYQLSADERAAMLRAVRAGTTRAVAIAGIHGARDVARRDAAYAADLGYDALMLHEPLDPLASEPGIVAYLRDLVAATSLPAVLYLRTPRLGPTAIRALAALPGVVGVKYALPALDLLAELVVEVPDCTWVNGRAESFAPACTALGVPGFTSGIGGVRPELALRVLDACRTRPASALDDLMRPIAALERLRNRNGGQHNVAVLKHVLRRDDVDAGGVRPPCAPLDDASRAEVDEVLAHPAWAPARASVS